MNENFVKEKPFVGDGMRDIEYSVLLQVKKGPVKNAAQAGCYVACFFVKDDAR